MAEATGGQTLFARPEQSVSWSRWSCTLPQNWNCRENQQKLIFDLSTQKHIDYLVIIFLMHLSLTSLVCIMNQKIQVLLYHQSLLNVKVWPLRNLFYVVHGHRHKYNFILKVQYESHISYNYIFLNIRMYSDTKPISHLLQYPRKKFCIWNSNEHNLIFFLKYSQEPSWVFNIVCICEVQYVFYFI